MKTRRRYMALKADLNGKLDSKDFIEAVWNALLRLYGEYGASKTSLTLVDYNLEKGMAIIRVAHTEVDKVRASLASITEIAAKPAAVHVLKVSGTIKALRRRIKASLKQQFI